jgi:hypothetical protein
MLCAVPLPNGVPVKVGAQRDGRIAAWNTLGAGCRQPGPKLCRHVDLLDRVADRAGGRDHRKFRDCQRVRLAPAGRSERCAINPRHR